MTHPTTVLVADDQQAARDVTARVLREGGHRVVTALDGLDALEKAAAERPDVVVLDVHMPRIDGIEACRRLKQKARLAGEFLPILFLSSRDDPQTRVEALRSGGEDFLGKPFDPDELRARIDVLLRTKRIVDDALRGRADAEEWGLSDRLTALYNQRYLTARLEEEFRRAERYNEPLSLLAIDLDEFEKVNGRFGRGAGDRLLVECARALEQTCRQTDVVTRAGGDEFVVVLPNTHFAGSLLLAERIWRDIRAIRIVERPGAIGCEASIGVACFPNRDVTSATDLLRCAHAALARAKAEGRGKICLYQYQGYLFQPC